MTPTLELTVLGSSGAWPEKGRACSGYLLESAGTRIVLDLGFGALPRLLEKCPAKDVDAVFITHAHPDHCVDLFGLYRARTLPDPPFPPLPVYCDPMVLDRIGGLNGPDGPDRLRSESANHPIGPDQTLEVGPFRVRTFGLPHFVPDLGFRVEVDGVVLAYTGDTGPTPRIAELARGADLFVCEATLEGPPRAGGERYLLTATEAGHYATEAGVARLMLTHFWPGADRAVCRSEASREFSGEILLADEGVSFSFP